MTISLKKLAIILGLIFVLIYIANTLIMKSINNMQKGALSSENEPVIAINDLKKKSKTLKTTTMRQWKEVDSEKLAKLKKYGITISPNNYRPSTPDQWHEYMDKRITGSRMFESEDAKEAAKIMRVNEQEYRETMDVNKEHETIVKELLSEDPFNKDYKDKLQNIYKMQAIGKVLKNKVVVGGHELVTDEFSASPKS